MDKEFGLMIRKLREKNSLSQGELAELSGLSQSFLSCIEAGQKSPTIRSLKLLAEALKLSPEDLFKGAVFSDKCQEIIDTREQIEKINACVASLYKETVGNAPRSISTSRIQDLILIHLKLDPEIIFESLRESKRGIELLGDLIDILVNTREREFINIIENIFNGKVKSFNYNYHNYELVMLLSIVD